MRGPVHSGPFVYLKKGGEVVSSKYDWDRISREYIEGLVQDDGSIKYPSLRELSELEHCPMASLARKSKAEQWPLKRERFVNKVKTKREQKKAETLSDEATRFDLSCFNISREGAEKAKRMLAQTEKPGDFAVLTKALKDLQAIAKTAIGDTGSGESAELKIEVTLGED